MLLSTQKSKNKTVFKSRKEEGNRQRWQSIHI